MAFDPKVDYMSLINAEKKKGINASQNDIDKWTLARNEKIAAASPTQLKQYNVTPQKEINQSYAPNTVKLRDYVTQGGITGDKKYNLSNIGSTPTINGIAIDPKAYGMKLVNGSWIGTQDQINKLLQPINSSAAGVATSNVTAVPQADATNKYTSMLDNQLNNLISSKDFNYDYTKDQTYNQYIDATTHQITSDVIKDMNRRGILSSSMTPETIATLVAQQGALAMPQFRGQALSEYQQNLSNLQNKYNATREIEESAYNRGQDTFMNKIQEANVTGNYAGLRTVEGQKFDWDKENTSWEQQYKDKTFDWQKAADIASTTQAGKEYALKMADFEWQKNKNNPDQMSKIIQNKLSLIDLKNYPEKKKLELATMLAQLEDLKINNKYSPKEKIAALNNLYAQTSAIYKGMEETSANITVAKSTAKNLDADTYGKYVGAENTKENTKSVKIENKNKEKKDKAIIESTEAETLYKKALTENAKNGGTSKQKSTYSYAEAQKVIKTSLGLRTGQRFDVKKTKSTPQKTADKNKQKLVKELIRLRAYGATDEVIYKLWGSYGLKVNDLKPIMKKLGG